MKSSFSVSTRASPDWAETPGRRKGNELVKGLMGTGKSFARLMVDIFVEVAMGWMLTDVVCPTSFITIGDQLCEETHILLL
jgi:hypothetical protein